MLALLISNLIDGFASAIVMFKVFLQVHQHIQTGKPFVFQVKVDSLNTSKATTAPTTSVTSKPNLYVRELSSFCSQLIFLELEKASGTFVLNKNVLQAATLV